MDASCALIARGISVRLTNRVHSTRHTPSNITGLRRAFNHAAHAA